MAGWTDFSGTPQATAFAPGTTWLGASWLELIGHPEPIGPELSECVFEEAAAAADAFCQVIDFQITTSNETIWPSGTGAAGVTTSTTITVQTNPATPGASVEIFFGEIPGSGGHVIHTGMRPNGTLAAANGTTDASGQFQTSYTSPIFGGAVAVLSRVGGANTTRGVTQEVTVPGLAALGASNDYVLHHNDPYHPAYHYGNAAAQGGLPLIASDYRTLFYGGGQIPVGERINFNDMSLINGGKFEAFLNPQFVASWQPTGGHAEHRVGRNCDVRNFNIPQDRRAALATIMQQRSGNPPLDEGNHWHLRF